MATMHRRPIDTIPMPDLEAALELYRATGLDALADMLARANRRNAERRAAYRREVSMEGWE
jgi:hypothetical protein